MVFCIIWLLSIPLWAYLVYSLNASEAFKRKLLFVIFTLQFSLIAGLRNYNSFNDSAAYYGHFNGVRDKGAFYDVHKERFEMGYLVFEKFVHKHISNDYPALFLITAFFCIGTTMYFFYKKSKCLWLACFVYVAMRTYFMQIQAVRQSMATALLLIAILCIEKRKSIIAVLLCLLATAFHSTSIVGFPLVVLSFFKLNKKNIALFCLLSFVCLFLMSALLSFLGQADSKYLEGENMKLGNILGLTFYSLLLFFAWKYGKDLMEENRIMFWGTMLCIFCSVIALVITAMNRAAEYFSPFAYVLFANVVESLPIHKKRYYTTFACAIVLSMYIVVLTLRPEWNVAYPYYFFWEKANLE